MELVYEIDWAQTVKSSYLCVHLLHQLTRGIDEIPYHGRKVLNTLGLASLSGGSLVRERGRSCSISGFRCP